MSDLSAGSRGEASPEEFDAVADNYEQELAQGLSVSGESSDYFAQKRIEWLSARLRERGLRPRSALDFGCGTGSSTPYLLDELGLETLLGVDVSRRSVEVASRRHAGTRARFMPLGAHEPAGDLELAFCNGVFHHIPPAQRPAAVAHVWRSLRPGGLWAFWENNPYNPGTRWVMSRIPFDRDAVTLTAREARGMLEVGGFDVLRVDHLFLFPGPLRRFRALEPLVAGLPLGAQYQILCRKAD